MSVEHRAVAVSLLADVLVNAKLEAHARMIWTASYVACLAKMGSVQKLDPVVRVSNAPQTKIVHNVVVLAWQGFVRSTTYPTVSAKYAPQTQNALLVAAFAEQENAKKQEPPPAIQEAVFPTVIVRVADSTLA